MTVADRFWAKVDKDGPGGCWLWAGKIDSCGYGQFRIGLRADRTRRMVAVHRFAYELEVGPIPEGLTIDHLCRIRRCVNPAHLEPVTARVNNLRADGTLARNAKKTHCPRGHAYDLLNTYVDPDGRRHCRACKREAHPLQAPRGVTVTLEERLDALEAENARLLDLAERQAENNRRLLALAERQLAALQAMAGIEPEPEPEPEPAKVRRACRATPPVRRYRRAQGGAR